MASASRALEEPLGRSENTVTPRYSAALRRKRFVPVFVTCVTCVVLVVPPGTYASRGPAAWFLVGSVFGTRRVRYLSCLPGPANDVPRGATARFCQRALSHQGKCVTPLGRARSRWKTS